MDMNQYTLFLPLDEKFESEELSLSYIVRLMFSVFQYRAAFFGKKIKKQTILMMHIICLIN